MSSIVKKLGLNAKMRILVIGAPRDYLKSLAPLPEGAVVSDKLAGTYEFLQFFATTRNEIKKTAKSLLACAAPGAMVWITYPKKMSGVGSDLSRDEVWAAMKGTGWRPVSQIAIDNVWSALRFRPVDDVKSKKARTV